MPTDNSTKTIEKKTDSTLSSVTVYEADRRRIKQLAGLSDTTCPKYVHTLLQQHFTSLPTSVQAAIEASR